jgi:excisionase family DNA binding protein
MPMASIDCGVSIVPQTKKPLRNRTQTSKSETNGSPAIGEVLSLAEAAIYLRVSEAAVENLIAKQKLPARRIGQEWRFLKAAIQNWLGHDSADTNVKAAQLAVAGSWKGDPLVEIELQETYRRRGELSPEDGQ